MDAQAKQRVAMNEATFRRINEGMQTAQGRGGELSFMCECGRLGCNRLIRMTRAEYERLRAEPRRFALLPGHEVPEVETVVARREGYVVVEKTGDPESDIVEQTDPRRHRPPLPD